MDPKFDLAPLSQLRVLYDEVELAILFDWLGIERPASLRALDIEAFPEDADQGAGPIRLRRDGSRGFGKFALPNAVARLLLSGIQDRLPQWRESYGDGRVQQTRPDGPRRRAKVEPLPRLLFAINWGDSGPGYSWPESYHVVHLPGFNRCVVTASQDSEDAYGYMDIALGHFSATEDAEAGIHRIILEWWRWQAHGHSQPRWADLLSSGEIGSTVAEGWADEVAWPEF